MRPMKNRQPEEERPPEEDRPMKNPVWLFLAFLIGTVILLVLALRFGAR
jgi:hypothetical protein